MADAIELGLAAWDGERGEWFLPVPAACEVDDVGDAPALSRIQERLAEATVIMRQRGPRAQAWVTRKIIERRNANDMPGVRRFGEIAAAIAQLSAAQQ